MKKDLIFVRCGNDFICGEGMGRKFAAGYTLENPMIFHYKQVPAPQKVHTNNRSGPNMLWAFEFIPMPCREIDLEAATFFGLVKLHDPVYVMYYKVLEALKEQDKSPLMVEQ